MGLVDFRFHGRRRDDNLFGQHLKSESNVLLARPRSSWTSTPCLKLVGHCPPAIFFKLRRQYKSVAIQRNDGPSRALFLGLGKHPKRGRKFALTQTAHHSLHGPQVPRKSRLPTCILSATFNWCREATISTSQPLPGAQRLHQQAPRVRSLCSARLGLTHLCLV